MSAYDNRKPKYVRDWYLKLRSKMKAIKEKKELEERREE